MATVQFSVRAEEDLLNIGAYTLRQWGETQAARYLDDLDHCASMLAVNPAIGRACGWVRSGLYRFEQGRHVLFYRKITNGIRVVRILHQSMLPDRHDFDDSDTGS